MSEEASIGPQLPPHLKKSSGVSKIVGPVLPPNLMPRRRESSPEAGSSCVIGPHKAMSSRTIDRAVTDDSSSSSESEDESIGPSVNLQGGEYDIRKEFADREKRKLEKDDESTKRDSWMTELPSDRTGVKIGLGARTFTKRDGEDTKLDDGWTETPGSEKKTDTKKSCQDEELLRIQRKRDAEIDAQLADYNAKKRSKPLIEMHKERDSHKKKKDKKEKKSKKEKKKKKEKKTSHNKEPPAERKAFNWEEDMRVSMVDTTRAKGMLDKTMLQSRFAASKKQKYL